MNTPDSRLHAALLADLAHTLRLGAGLGSIVTTVAPAAGHEDDRGAHDRLVGHLASGLDVQHGLTAILGVEGGHASLVDDLSGTLDASRGLTAILRPEHGRAPAAALADVYAAPDPCRLSTRALGLHHALDRAVRELRDVRDHLADVPLDLEDGDSDADLAGVLVRQRELAAKASRALGTALTTGDEAASLKVTMTSDLLDVGVDPTFLPHLDAPAEAESTPGDEAHLAGAIVVGSGGGGFNVITPSVARLAERLFSHGTPVASEDEVDRGAVAEAGDVLRQAADELGELNLRLADRSGGMGVTAWRQCTGHVDSLIQALDELGAALSDFRGADLRAMQWQPTLEDLDGVRWSDATATGGATRWPEAIREAVADPLVSQATAAVGVYVVRFGTVVGTSR
ncbi:hypothetical protein GCM10009827_072490 [Dactylosporangium maewongense]|uniref:Peptidase A2 domain-containing protein n=1 Tax=Dactylosporangium maewongense TaxID=634393 RepID=A0ABP4MDE6_9ACTN